MEIRYKSTRSDGETVTASQAILKGLAEDGGLFVPTAIPGLGVSLEEISKMNYQETAYQVMKQFLTDFTEEELKTCINRAYDEKFDTKENYGAAQKNLYGSYWKAMERCLVVPHDKYLGEVLF